MPGRVRWGVELRRYRTSLYLLHQDISKEPAHPPLHWSLDGPLVLPGDGGAGGRAGTGGRHPAPAGGWCAGWLARGGALRPAGRNSHHELRKLFQERDTPWERSRIPLIFIDGALAAVPGLWVCEPFQAHAQEAGVQIYWQKPLWQVTPSRA
jgi:tRNA(Ile)-lysidine synthase